MNLSAKCRTESKEVMRFLCVPECCDVVLSLFVAQSSVCWLLHTFATPLCHTVTDKTATAVGAQGSSLCVIKLISFVFLRMVFFLQISLCFFLRFCFCSGFFFWKDREVLFYFSCEGFVFF